ncbi:MAG TPA: RsmB/NOP family class I SAM-dependent RNA methyltransferase [Alphaproteobacteria bacterium]|nr:RsmB/NOP family class I SAM-dependent RNA methyltransferase [Alphaproteobacteria bacterium]
MAKLLDIDEVVAEASSIKKDSDLQDVSSDSENHSTAHRLEKIPRDVLVKKRFEDHYRELLGEDYDKFMNYSLSYIRKCIRVNRLKSNVESIKARLSDRWQLEPIPWCSEGFWITYRDGKRFDLGNLMEHHLGYIYVQEAASMIPPVVLDPQPGEVVLDMCAAPGSKTTQIAMYMENSGLLVANDVSGSRLKALGMNMQRCGVNNHVLTMMQEHRFKRIGENHPDFKFDRILVDAPCSGTGTIRKSLKTILMWNPLGITKLSKIQKNLIEIAFNMLKPNGVMVYSTCTIEPEENEAVVSFLLNKYPNAELEYIDDSKLGIKRTPAIKKFKNLEIRPEVENCLRIHPYDNDTEGFFVARIRKKE